MALCNVKQLIMSTGVFNQHRPTILREPRFATRFNREHLPPLVSVMKLATSQSSNLLQRADEHAWCTSELFLQTSSSKHTARVNDLAARACITSINSARIYNTRT